MIRSVHVGAHLFLFFFVFSNFPLTSIFFSFFSLLRCSFCCRFSSLSAFSILGMNLFGCKFCRQNPTDNSVHCDRKNFDSLLWALVTVFQVSCCGFLVCVDSKWKWPITVTCQYYSDVRQFYGCRQSYSFCVLQNKIWNSFNLRQILLQPFNTLLVIFV